MAIAMQGLVSRDVEEKTALIEKLVLATGGTGWMHEKFNPNNPKRFDRSWFCWPDSLFAELVMSITDQCPQPTKHKYRVKEWRDTEHQVQGGIFSMD
jgi:meiotically up-regulated gene 157 (Mug157) protein